MLAGASKETLETDVRKETKELKFKYEGCGKVC